MISIFRYVCMIKNSTWHRFCYLPFWGERAREQFPVEYYSLVSDLSQEKDELFATFCKLTKRATETSVHELFEYLKNYSYQHIPTSGNGLVWAVSEIQNRGIEETFVNDFLKVWKLFKSEIC